MKFKKVQITKENSTEVTILENTPVWFSYTLGSLHVGDLSFTGVEVINIFWIPDNVINFQTIKKYDKIQDIFIIKAYL